MAKWSVEIQDELASLLKDWLKQQGRTQADLGRSLKATSSRMPALLEALEQEHKSGGLPKVAEALCKIESSWANTFKNKTSTNGLQREDPFGQLDLIMQEIKDDCEN